MQVEKRGAPSAEISNTCWEKKKKKQKERRALWMTWSHFSQLLTSRIFSQLLEVFLLCGWAGTDKTFFFHIFHKMATLRWQYSEETPVPSSSDLAVRVGWVYFHCTEMTAPTWCHRLPVLFLLGSLQGICSVGSMKNILNKSVHIIKSLLAPWKCEQV